jgi:DNA-binding response OmpR family regulator
MPRELGAVAADPGDALPSASSAFRARARELGIDLSSEVAIGDVVVDLELYAVRRGTTTLDMSPRQVELLAAFVAAPGRVFSRDQLHWLCWEDVSPSRRVDVQLCRIRAKVGFELFRNVRDRGWALRPPV